MTELEAATRMLRGLGATAEPDRLRVTRDGALATFTLDSPGARNGLSLGMMLTLGEEVAGLASRDEVAAVLLRAEGPAFCAGGDLREVRSSWGTPEGGRAVAAAMGAILDALLQLPAVVVAAVHGPAIGGGAELLTAADVRVLGPEGAFEFRQVRLGVACGWGGARRLPLHVAAPTATTWLLGGARVDREAATRTAYAIGADDAEAGARAFLASVLASPVAAVRAQKTQIAAARAPWLGDRTADVAAFASVWGGPAHRAALR
jgi:enoyl-CoA hydratase/carnithine racemase